MIQRLVAIWVIFEPSHLTTEESRKQVVTEKAVLVKNGKAEGDDGYVEDSKPAEKAKEPAVKKDEAGKPPAPPKPVKMDAGILFHPSKLISQRIFSCLTTFSWNKTTKV